MTELSPGNYRGNICVREVDGSWYMAVGCDLYPSSQGQWTEITEDLYK